METQDQLTPLDSLAGRRAVLHTIRHRRWRVLRDMLIFVVATAAIVILVMARRDDQDIQQCRLNLEFAAKQFQEDLAQHQPLPTDLPRPHGPAPLMRDHYHYAVLNSNLLAMIQPLGICCCAEPHRLFLRPNGRHVIIYDGRNFRVEWLEETEFRRRAAALHLNLLPPGP